MIFNIIKHFFMALLLDAGAAMAFDVDLDEPAPITATAPAQSCALPAPQINSFDSGTQS
jgi:hypothetical protein